MIPLDEGFLIVEFRRGRGNTSDRPGTGYLYFEVSSDPLRCSIIAVGRTRPTALGDILHAEADGAGGVGKRLSDPVAEVEGSARPSQPRDTLEYVVAISSRYPVE